MRSHLQSQPQRHPCGGRQAPLRGAQDELGPPDARVCHRTHDSPLSIATDTPIAPSTLRFVHISLAHLAQSPLAASLDLPCLPRAITLGRLARYPLLVSLSISLGRLDLPCSPRPISLDRLARSRLLALISLGHLARSHSATSISLGPLDLPCSPRSPLLASISLAPRSDSTLLRRRS